MRGDNSGDNDSRSYRVRAVAIKLATDKLLA